MTLEKIVIERSLKAPPPKVWRMWTTKAGIEKWWGPEGFSTVVTRIDLRVGGGFTFVMTAERKDIVDYLKSTGVPVSSSVSATYTEVVPEDALGYVSTVDFVPNTAPYETSTLVKLLPAGTGTKLVVTTDVMHDPHWTEMARQGWVSQLDKLEAETRGD